MTTHRHRIAVAIASVLAVTAPALAGEIDLSALGTASHHEQFIVHLHGAAATADNAAGVRGLLGRAASTTRTAGTRVQRQLATGAVVVRTPQPLDPAEATQWMQAIASDPQVAWVEVDQRLHPALDPNDPLLDQQWGFGTSPASLNVREAWDSTSGQGQVVAIIDTGRTRHPELDANTLPGYDFISDARIAGDGDGRDADAADEGDGNGTDSSSWHGTHVAGTVAAATNNGKGVAGTASGARIFHARVLGKGGGYVSDIADAMVWSAGGDVRGVPANANPAAVLNLSLGGRGNCSRATQTAVDAAVQMGATVVVAAGNKNTDVRGHTPANCRGVVAVAATTARGARASFSNYGQGITLSAPGDRILSTFNSGAMTPGSPSYGTYSGTSMAAPHVAGVVALMQSVADRPLSPEMVKDVLIRTARPLAGSCPQGCGAGIANAAGAVEAVSGL